LNIRLQRKQTLQAAAGDSLVVRDEQAYGFHGMILL
jgi:hypothetical protein